jgi:hypothetical protein
MYPDDKLLGPKHFTVKLPKHFAVKLPKHFAVKLTKRCVNGVNLLINCIQTHLDLTLKLKNRILKNRAVGGGGGGPVQ